MGDVEGSTHPPIHETPAKELSRKVVAVISKLQFIVFSRVFLAHSQVYLTSRNVVMPKEIEIYFTVHRIPSLVITILWEIIKEAGRLRGKK